MTPIEHIPRELEPETASGSATPEPAAKTAPTHFPKIAAAVRALQAAGAWPPNMRPLQAYRLTIDRLIADGHGDDLPKRDTVRRYLQRLGC